MRTAGFLFFLSVVAAVIAGSLAAQQSGTVKVKSDELGGIVSSASGVEAGVWVIAETTDLPTRYIKEVVTNDQGRYLIPSLPAATYTVWARGYGLVDSPKLQTRPGKQVDLKPSVAPDKKAAAQYYPANYWYSMLAIPKENEFPGTGPSGNGISPNIKTQGQWLHLVKTDSCESCHQLGNQYTRTIPEMFSNFDSPAKAWMRRVQSGQAGRAMVGGLNQLGPDRATAEFGDWTTRIAHGELPAEAPPRRRFPEEYRSEVDRAPRPRRRRRRPPRVHRIPLCCSCAGVRARAPSDRARYRRRTFLRSGRSASKR